MIQLLAEDVARERYDAILREAKDEHRAAQQLRLTRAFRRVDRARKLLERALEESYALPAQPNPFDRAGGTHAEEDDFRKLGV